MNPKSSDGLPILLVAGLLLLSGCDRKADSADVASVPSKPTVKPAAAEAAKVPSTPTVNASMTQVMSVHAQTIWDLSSKAFNARGDGLVASKLSAQDWAMIAEAGRQLESRASLLATAPQIKVAGPGETILGAEAAHQTASIGHTWDAADAQQIQARIDANRPLFTRRAKVLVQAGNDLVKAAQTRKSVV